MQIAQIRWSAVSGWEPISGFSGAADLVLVFADTEYFQKETCYTELRALFPEARILGCSSSGSVLGEEISDGDMVATAISLEHSSARLAVVDFEPGKDVRALGMHLMAELGAEDLRHVFVLSDGLQVNGSELAQGLNRVGVPVTGGLAGDAARFGKTWVMADAPAKTGRIAALGFYGAVTVKSGCFAGWKEFGAERLVTKSTGNVV